MKSVFNHSVHDMLFEMTLGSYHKITYGSIRKSYSVHESNKDSVLKYRALSILLRAEYRVEKTNVHLYRPVDFGYKMHSRIKILALHGQHNLQTLIQSQKNVGQIPNFLLKSSKRLRRSELHCAHSSINVGLLCHCSLYGYEFFDNFCLFVILIYDIYNKISKLDLSGHFCFWPLLASFRGH